MSPISLKCRPRVVAAQIVRKDHENKSREKILALVNADGPRSSGIAGCGKSHERSRVVNESSFWVEACSFGSEVLCSAVSLEIGLGEISLYQM